MARNFDGTDYLTLADHAALSLGDDVDSSGPFSLVFWLRCDTMSDTDYHYMMSWGNLAASPSVSIMVFGDNHATLAGKIWVQFKDSGSADANGYLSDAIIDADWHHVALVFDGIWLKAWLDGSPQTNLSLQPTLDTIDVAAPWYLGRYSGSASDYLSGDMAEWAKWDVALSTEQIAALAAGVRPPEVGTRPAWYMPMLAGLDEEIAGLVATNNGSTIAEHPPAIICPGIPHVLRPIWPAIAGPYQVLAAATHAAGTAEGQIFSAGTTIGQVNEQ